jgi:tripartite-type tricarboxylate transporter receptor subunit TctC
MKQTLAKIGFESKVGAPEDFAAFIAEELARWVDVAKITGVKID